MQRLKVSALVEIPGRRCNARVYRLNAATMGVAVRTGCFFKDHIGAAAYRNETTDKRLRRRGSGMRRNNIVEVPMRALWYRRRNCVSGESKKLTGNF